MSKKIKLRNLNIDIVTYSEITKKIISSHLHNQKPKLVFTPNAGHLSELFNSNKIAELYRNSDFNLIDGWPIALAASIVCGKKINRIKGSDLVPLIFQNTNKQIRIGIIGGENELVIRSILEKRFPNLNLQLVNCDRWDTSDNSVSRIRKLIQYNALSIVIFALGHPKQEILAFKLKEYDWLGSKPDWILCVGASIDFIIGKQKRAPIILQKIGMEWLFRLLINPKRMFFRYLFSLIPSLKLILFSLVQKVLNHS